MEFHMGMGNFIRLSDQQVSDLAQIVKDNTSTIICEVCPFKSKGCPCRLKDNTVINVMEGARELVESSNVCV